LRPNDDRAYFLRAQTQMAQQRDVPGAVASARRALELAPVAANHYLLGTTLYHAKDYESARVELRQALTMEPDNVEYRRALSEIP
jgi:tetratricopeptide (TPR) repeat protein